jgi:hypothetical protein
MTLDFGLFAVIMRDFAGLGWQRVSDPWESKRFGLQEFVRLVAVVLFCLYFLENINLSLIKLPEVSEIR